MESTAFSEGSPWATQATAIVPRRRRDIVEHPFEQEAILYDPQTGRAYFLNETGFTVWRQCEGRATTHQLARQHVDAYDVDFDTALDHVEELIAFFAESNLLDGEVLYGPV